MQLFKKTFGSGTTALIMSNKETEDMKKSLEGSGYLIKGETIKNEAKEHKGGFFGMLFATLAASFLVCALAGIRVIKGGDGVIRAGEE